MNRRDSFKTAAAGLLAAVWPRRSEMTNLKTTSNPTTVYDPADFGDDCQEWHDPLFQALNEEAHDFDRQTGLASLMHGNP